MVFTAVLFALPAHAAETYYAELAPFRAPLSQGSGAATMILADDLSAVDFVVTYQNLTSPEVYAHIHRADGTIAFTFEFGTPKVGRWLSPPAEEIAELRNQVMYVNIHTEVYPVGEIRGTLLRQVTPVKAGTWGAIKALYR
jgi:hypothetical protein